MLETLTDISARVDSILSVDYNDLTKKNIDSALEQVLAEVLLESAEQACEETIEFGYEPLKERLLENLSDPRHVKVRNGKVVTLFNEKVAGTYSDLVKGLEEAGGHTGTPNAHKVWKYGIYFQGDAYADRNLPTYEEVIDERLSAWGDKAPYWYFIEYGTISEYAFPQFAPTYFISGLRKVARQAEGFAVDVFSLLTEKFLDAEVEDIKTGDIKAGTSKAVSRIIIPSEGLRATKMKSSTGKIFYTINGVRGLNPREALTELRSYIKK